MKSELNPMLSTIPQSTPRPMLIVVLGANVVSRNILPPEKTEIFIEWLDVFLINASKVVLYSFLQLHMVMQIETITNKVFIDSIMAK